MSKLVDGEDAVREHEDLWECVCEVSVYVWVGKGAVRGCVCVVGVTNTHNSAKESETDGFDGEEGVLLHLVVADFLRED